MSDIRHFIDINLLDKKDLLDILSRARAIKKTRHKDRVENLLLPNYQLGMFFQKPSTRTRVSFEVGINELGGKAILLTYSDSQLGRGESVADTAKVMSRYVDIIMIRTYRHETLKEMAENATIPVINGLTDFSHPCQVMADLMTVQEYFGDIRNKVITWCGDFNNVATSWAHAAQKLGFTLKLACPEELAPPVKEDNFIQVYTDPREAIKDADVVLTDTWISMGDDDAANKKEMLQPYQINSDIMSLAKPDAIFMHCLPAHRGEEVTGDVIDGKQSVVFDEAENRLHVQKAIMLWCLGK